MSEWVRYCRGKGIELQLRAKYFFINMKPRLTARGGSAGAILILLSCLASFYTAGRLWQDAKMRQILLDLARQKAKETAVTVEDSFKLLDFREKEKRLASLEMELAAAKMKGYASDTAYSVNGTGPGRYLAVIGINTGFGQKNRRDSLRSTWMPTGPALAAFEKEKRIILRFTVGRSANRGDVLDKAIDEENVVTKDFLILEDHEEGYDELPKKTKLFFSMAIARWDADFFLKIDDDVYINLDRLGAMLAAHQHKARVYLGCMKSGEVFTEAGQKWHEPEWWKFGDAKFYFRHATGQVYGLSKALAQYVSVNREILHEYRNEDVSLGSWMLGLDAAFEDDRRLCCSSEGDCARRTGAEQCIAVFDWRCSGICNSVERMKGVHSECS